MIYYNVWKDPAGNITFIYDPDKPIPEAFRILENNQMAREILKVWVSYGVFTGLDKREHKIRDEPLLFLSDFIPRVCGFESNMKTADNMIQP